MQKKKRIRLVIFIFLIAVLVCFLLIPKSIHVALHWLRYPFEVGEVIATEEIDQIQYEGVNLIPIFYKGYPIFFGYGTGHSMKYQLYDQNGNELEHIKPLTILDA